VLIAITLAVVVGMAALAIDGSRAYSLRRDLQAAVDSAALAAGDSLQQTGSYPTAEAAATRSFGMNLRLYSPPACAPGYGTPGAGALTVTCTYSDGTALTQVVSSLGPAGSSFTLTGTRSLLLQFARILTNGTTPRVSAVAGGGVNNLLYQPTLAALSHAGCGGVPGSAISVAGTGVLGVTGDVVSSGAISVSGTGTAEVAGDVYARCQSSIAGLTTMCYPSGDNPPCTYPDVAGVTRSGYNFVDPQYPPPAVAGGAQGRPGNNVVLSPGVYAADPVLNTRVCYFLSPGVYRWSGGYTNNGDFVSNDLKPPDEPNYNDNTQRARQFWNNNGINCAGSADVSAVNGFKGVPQGAWAFVLTSTRTDTFAGVSYKRESGPSMCYTETLAKNQNVEVDVSNVPGATAYNIYAAPSGSCNGPFGLAATLPVSGSVLNNQLGPCPQPTANSCSLGNETIFLDSTVLTSSFTPNGAAPGVTGSYPPAGETAPLGRRLANENANRSAPPGGDRGNENQCDTVAGALSTCPDEITPGAVEFYIPAGGCLNSTSAGDNIIFSGYQYDWVVLYEPGAANPPANTCSNLMGAASDSAFIGLIYLPAAAVTVQKAGSLTTDEMGGLIASTITFTGFLPAVIGDPVDYGPIPQASRLIS
jgi:hypothetical protein